MSEVTDEWRKSAIYFLLTEGGSPGILDKPDVTGRKRRQYGLNRITYTIENRGFLRYFGGNIQDDEWLNSTKLLKLPGGQSCSYLHGPAAGPSPGSNFECFKLLNSPVSPNNIFSTSAASRTGRPGDFPPPKLSPSF